MAMDTAEATEQAPAAESEAVYMSYKEAREGASSHHHHGHGRSTKSRTVKFYLVDKDDNAVLAVEGEDLGDAHYDYHNVEGFDKYGTIQVHTRKEVVEWLEMIIHETQLKSKGSDSSMQEQTPVDEDGLYYTRHEQRRDHLPDGRRINKWLLIDQHEQEHLAVQGQERDARDGHYVYGAVEPFSSRAPMPACTNQQQVMHWLEQFISHHAPKSAMHVGDHIRTGPSHGTGTPRRSRSPRSTPHCSSPPADGMARRSKRSRTATDPGHRSGASSPTISPPDTKAVSPAAPSPISHVTMSAALGAALGAADEAKPGAAGATTSAQKSASAKAAKGGKALGGTGGAKGGGRLGGAAEASQARRIKAIQAAAKLQVTALEQAARSELQRQVRAACSQQEASRTAALQWTTHPTPVSDVGHLEAYLPVISAALASEGIALSPAARAALAGLEAPPPPLHPRAARLELLEALREASTVYCAADVLAQRHAVEVVTACLQFPCTAVQQIAQHALRQWRHVALVHLRVLTDPMAAIDPQRALQDAEAEGSLVVPIPQHLQDALEGIVPPAKAAPAPTPNVTAQKLPNQSPTKSPLRPVIEPVGPVLSQRSLSFGAALTGLPSTTPAAVTPALGATSSTVEATPATGDAAAAGGQSIVSRRLTTPAAVPADAAAAAAPADATPAPPAVAEAGGEAPTAAKDRGSAGAGITPALISQGSVAFEIGPHAIDGLPETPLQIGAFSQRQPRADTAAPVDPRSAVLPGAASAGPLPDADGAAGVGAKPDGSDPLQLQHAARSMEQPEPAAPDSGAAPMDTDAAPDREGACGEAACASGRLADEAAEAATRPYRAASRSPQPKDARARTPELAGDTAKRQRSRSRGRPSGSHSPSRLREPSAQPSGDLAEQQRRASGGSGGGTPGSLEVQRSGSFNMLSAHALARSDSLRTTPGRTMPLQTLNESPARARQVLAGSRTAASPAGADGSNGLRPTPARRGSAPAGTGAAAAAAEPVSPLPERQSSLQALRAQHGMHGTAADAMHAHMLRSEQPRDSHQVAMPWDDRPATHPNMQRRGSGGVGPHVTPRDREPRGSAGQVLRLNDIFADPSSPPGAAHHSQRGSWGHGGGRGGLRSNMDRSLSSRFQGSVTGWGSEAEEAAALARLAPPVSVTPASVLKLAATLREELPRLPQRVVAPLCTRVHSATLQLLAKLALPDKQAEMAREQVSACAEALNNNASQLAATMSASERHRILEHVHEFARDLIMQLNVLGLGLPPAAP
eukprot:jgi/Ulvmu1/10763/UM068_0053.1